MNYIKKTVVWDHSNEIYWSVLPCVSVHHTAQSVSNILYILEMQFEMFLLNSDLFISIPAIVNETKPKLPHNNADPENNINIP